MTLFIRTITLAIFLLATSAINAFSQTLDSSFYNWTVYEIDSSSIGNKKCYMVSHPISQKTNDQSREVPYIIITRYQNERNEEVGIFSGYEYKINSDIFVVIDDLKFNFHTNKDMAWTKTKEQDSFIIQKMLNGRDVFVRSNSSIGTFGVDRYSLKGVAKAYNRVKEICGS